MRPADTTPEAWEVFLDIQRRMTPGQKLVRVFEHSAFVRSLIFAGIRRRRPDASEREIFLQFAHQTLGDDLFTRVYGNEFTPTTH